MVDIKDLRAVLDWELNVKKYNLSDRFNGLLVTGRRDVYRIGFAVNTTLDNINEARNRRVDFLIVHNGGWGETDCDNQEKKKRLLDRYKMSLYITHASLDCHDKFGVAAALSERLGVTQEGKFASYCGGYAGRYGSINVAAAKFKKNLKDISPNHRIVGKFNDVKNIAVVGGDGASKVPWLFEAARKRCTVLVTGSSSLYGEIYAYERGLSLVMLGETNSDQFGLRSLADFLKERFSDIDTVIVKEKSW